MVGNRSAAEQRLTQTIVPLKLNFAAQKKGAWPSRPCGDCLLSRTLPIGTKGADRSTKEVLPAR